MRLKELSDSSAGERRTKKFKIVIDFEKGSIEQLKQVGIMKSYSVDLVTGRVENFFLIIFFLLPKFPDKAFN